MKTTLFFRRTAVIGGAPAVADFMAKEKGIIAESSLPPTFTRLHTEYGALNQAGARHRASRKGMAPLFSAESFAAFVPKLDAALTGFVERLAASDGAPVAVVPETKAFCLDLFAELFVGEPLSAAEREAFDLVSARGRAVWGGGGRGLTRKNKVQRGPALARRAAA